MSGGVVSEIAIFHQVTGSRVADEPPGIVAEGGLFNYRHSATGLTGIVCLRAIIDRQTRPT